jgi:FkbM family methyltransferase
MEPHREPRQAFLGSVRSLTGVPIYVDLRDERARRLIASGGNFNPSTLAMWHGLLGEDDWTEVIDVGANYGEMLASGGLPRGARILAVEPNPRIVPFLRETLSSLEGARLLEIALSDREGHAEFLVDRAWSGLSRIVADGSGSTTVPTTTLGRLLTMAGMPLGDMRVVVKLDVEGHEVSVLSGALDALPTLRNFAALVEIAHLSDRERSWIARHFDVFGFDLRTRRLMRTDRFDREAMKSASLYDQDVVIRRKQLS